MVLSPPSAERDDETKSLHRVSQSLHDGYLCERDVRASFHEAAATYPFLLKSWLSPTTIRLLLMLLGGPKACRDCCCRCRSQGCGAIDLHRRLGDDQARRRPRLAGGRRAAHALWALIRARPDLFLLNVYARRRQAAAARAIWRLPSGRLLPLPDEPRLSSNPDGRARQH